MQQYLNFDKGKYVYKSSKNVPRWPISTAARGALHKKVGPITPAIVSKNLDYFIAK